MANKTPVSGWVEGCFCRAFFGKRLAYTYEFIDIKPNDRIRMRTSEGPFPMETTYEWVSMDEVSTKMTLRNKGEPKGFSILLSPFMTMAMRLANRKDLRKLKSLLEGKDNK